MRSFLGARPLFAVALISLVLIAGMGGPGALVFAQQSETPVAGQEAEPPASGSISEEEPSAELPTDVPAPPTEVPLPPTEAPLPPTEAPPPPIEPVVLEPTAPIELPATDEPIVPAAEDTTLYVDPGVCSPGLYYWQVFVTMDGPEFPATATLTFDNGDTATVPYNQSSYIGGRYYGYFEWYGNLTNEFVSITGAFPIELNPSVESVSGPSCGPAAATATATATTANTETATATVTGTPTVANTTLDASSATCSTGLGFWQVFVTMDGPQFPATGTLAFSNGDTATVPYNQSSYINGRYYGYFQWSGNQSEYLVSITGAFPAGLNPSVESVSGPNCGPATETPTATATTANTETATVTNTPMATATATVTPIVAITTLYVDPEVCSTGLSYWQVFVTMDGPEFPATATLTFSNGDTAVVPYQQSSYIGGRYYGFFEWYGNVSEYLVSISGVFPAALNPSLYSASGPNCGPATATETATATATTANTETATATATGTATVANITLVPDPGVCSPGLYYWQVFVTMDQPEFPATATMTFSNGDTAVVPYNQSSYIGGRYYGYFEWYGNLTDEFVSITGAFPAGLNPSVESVSGPNCGPATVTATATATTANTETATVTNTATATGTATSTPTVANITLDAATATCYTGLNYWQVFVTMDGPEFPATATLTFDNGDTAVVPYNQSSYIGGRYYGYFEWTGNVSDYLVSVSGAFPAELNPSVESVSGPNCGPETATATATTANTETATATGTATGTPSNTPVASATATAGPMVVTRNNVNCRTGGGTSFSSLGVVARNTSLPLRGAEVNGWIPVVCFEQDGWIISDQLNPGPVATATVPSGSTVVTTARVNCRVGANTSSAIIGVVASNTTLAMRGPSQGGWTPVVCFEQDGWLSSTYVNTQPTPTATFSGGTLVTTTTRVNCRVAGSASSAILGVVDSGIALQQRGSAVNGWTPVVCFEQNGWISSRYLTLLGTSTPTGTATVAPPTGTATATPSPSLTSTPTNTATVTPTLIPLEGTAFLQANANCRVGPGTGFASLGVVNRNAQIPLRGGLQNGWYPVVCFGQDGWILGNYIAVRTATPTRTATPLPPSSTPTATVTMTATATNTATVTPTLIPLEGTAFLQANANCRVGPGTGFASLGVVNRNARIPLRGGLQNGWYPVVCFGQDGWILGNYIAVQTPTPTATATATLPSSGSVVTTVTVNCRVGPSTTSPVIVVVATGTTLTLRGATEGEWTPVTCGGQDGWITSRFLR